MKVRRRRGDRGVITVLFALLLVALILVVALVIDYGFVRNSRQDAKSIADATTAAAMQSMATNDAKFYPWAGACTGAAYLQANDPETTYTFQYLDGSGTPVSGSPCSTLLSQQCQPNTPSTWAWIRATGTQKVVDIRAGYSLPDASFPEDAKYYAGDSGGAFLGSCDQLATIVVDEDDVYFGSVGGATRYETAIRTVGRAVVKSNNRLPAAFLMLERKDCDVLSQQVGSGQGIAVEPPSATQPARIHLDSSGKGACEGNAAGAYTLYSSTLGSTPSFPGIRLLGTASNQGQLTMRALDPTVGTPANAYSTATGVCTTYVAATNTCQFTAPTSARVVGRAPVDDKYNPTPEDGLSFLQELHAEAVADARRTAAPMVVAPGVPWHTISTCSGHVASDADKAATRVFVACPDVYAPTNASFDNADEVVFNGRVNLANGSVLRMPRASRVVVGGTTEGGITTAGGSTLTINTDVIPTDATYTNACAATDGAPDPAVPRRTTSLTIFGGQTSGQGGALIVGGIAAFCQTSIYIAGPKSTATGAATSYSALSSTDTSYDLSCGLVPCSLSTALPKSGLRVLSNGLVRWSAPNRSTAQPPDGLVGDEDLSLWTESAGGVLVAGELAATGVFFIPNGEVQMRSPSTFTPRDAQFIARRLELLQGSLLMKPTPGNAVLIESLGGIGLVR